MEWSLSGSFLLTGIHIRLLDVANFWALFYLSSFSPGPGCWLIDFRWCWCMKGGDCNDTFLEQHHFRHPALFSRRTPHRRKRVLSEMRPTDLCQIIANRVVKLSLILRCRRRPSALHPPSHQGLFFCVPKVLYRASEEAQERGLCSATVTIRFIIMLYNGQQKGTHTVGDAFDLAHCRVTVRNKIVTVWLSSFFSLYCCIPHHSITGRHESLHLLHNTMMTTNKYDKLHQEESVSCRPW